jgi:hypothetical protein
VRESREGRPVPLVGPTEALNWSSGRPLLSHLRGQVLGWFQGQQAKTTRMVVSKVVLFIPCPTNLMGVGWGGGGGGGGEGVKANWPSPSNFLSN